MPALPFALVRPEPIDAARAADVGTVLLVLRELAAMLPEPSLGTEAMRGLILTGLAQYEAAYDRHVRKDDDWTAALHHRRQEDQPHAG